MACLISRLIEGRAACDDDGIRLVRNAHPRPAGQGVGAVEDAKSFQFRARSPSIPSSRSAEQVHTKPSLW